MGDVEVKDVSASDENYKSTENLRLTKEEDAESQLIAPSIWVPVSLFIAVILAIANNIASYLSDYGFRLRYLMSPGSLFANILALSVISHSNFLEFENNFGVNTHSEADQVDNSEDGIQPKVLFKWFYNIYFRQRVEVTRNKKLKKGRIVKTKLTVRWARVWVTLILCVLNVLQYWIFIEGYHFAKKANLNSGVIMSMYCIKPLLMSVFFFCMFGQRLNIYEMIGILLSCICIGFISMSHGKMDFDEFDIDLLIAILLIVISVVFLCVSAVIMKYYFAYKRNNINIPAFVNFFNLIIDIIFFVLFVIECSLFSGYPWFDLFLAQISGFLWSIATFLIVYVNLRGKAGPSEALIETCVIYQTIIDAIFFFRIPNFTQLTGVAFGLLATLVIMLGESK